MLAISEEQKDSKVVRDYKERKKQEEEQDKLVEEYNEWRITRRQGEDSSWAAFQNEKARNVESPARGLSANASTDSGGSNSGNDHENDFPQENVSALTGETEWEQAAKKLADQAWLALKPYYDQYPYLASRKAIERLRTAFDQPVTREQAREIVSQASRQLQSDTEGAIPAINLIIVNDPTKSNNAVKEALAHRYPGISVEEFGLWLPEDHWQEESTPIGDKIDEVESYFSISAVGGFNSLWTSDENEEEFSLDVVFPDTAGSIELEHELIHVLQWIGMIQHSGASFMDYYNLLEIKHGELPVFFNFLLEYEVHMALIAPRPNRNPHFDLAMRMTHLGPLAGKFSELMATFNVSKALSELEELEIDDSVKEYFRQYLRRFPFSEFSSLLKQIDKQRTQLDTEYGLGHVQYLEELDALIKARRLLIQLAVYHEEGRLQQDPLGIVRIRRAQHAE